MLIAVFILAVLFSVIFAIGAIAERPRFVWPALVFFAVAAGVAVVGVLT